MFYNSLKILHIKCATLYFSYRGGLLCKEKYLDERQPLEEAIKQLKSAGSHVIYRENALSL